MGEEKKRTRRKERKRDENVRAGREKFGMRPSSIVSGSA